MDALTTLGEVMEMAGVETSKLELAPPPPVVPVIDRVVVEVKAYCPGLMLDTALPLHGHIVVATATKREGIHWTLVPGIIQEGKLERLPSIHPTARIGVRCDCGFKDEMWQDIFVRKFPQVEIGNPQSRNGIKCPKCTARMKTVRLNSVLKPQEGDVFPVWQKNPAEAERNLRTVFEKGDDGKNIALPQIWAWYDQGNCPDHVWQPRTAHEMEVVKMAADYQHEGAPRPLETIPLKVALPYHDLKSPISTGLGGFWLENMTTEGYIDRAMLTKNVERDGFNRAYVHSPRTEVPHLRSARMDRQQERPSWRRKVVDLSSR